MKLYDLIHNTPWEMIKKQLIELYPDITKSESNLNGFKSAYNDMLQLTPVEADEYIYFGGRRCENVSLKLPDERQLYCPMDVP